MASHKSKTERGFREIDKHLDKRETITVSCLFCDWTETGPKPKMIARGNDHRWRYHRRKRKKRQTTFMDIR